MGPYNFRINVFIEISLRIVYSELLFSAKKKLRKTIIMIKNVFSWYFHLPLRIHWRFLTILLKTQQTFVLVKTYWRRLEDVFSVTFFCLPRRLHDIIARSLLEDILVTSWRRRLENFLKMSCEGVLKMWRPEDVFRTSWRSFWKTFCNYVLKTSSQDERLLHWRRLEDVLKTSWKARNVCWEAKKWMK